MMSLNPGIRGEEEIKFVFSVAPRMLSKKNFVLLAESNARSVRDGTISHECVRALHANCNDNDLLDDDSFADAWLAAVPKGLKKSKSTARVIVIDQEVRFLIDTGAEVNIICQKFVRKDQVRPVAQRFIMWNGTKMIPRGKVTLPVYVQNDHKPLENILRKPLSQAPRRLQNPLMRLHRYDCEFQYVEVPQLFIADNYAEQSCQQGFFSQTP